MEEEFKVLTYEYWDSQPNKEEFILDLEEFLNEAINNTSFISIF